MKLPTDEGAPARYMDGDGSLLDEHGNVLQRAQDGPGDKSSTSPTWATRPPARTPRAWTPPPTRGMSAMTGLTMPG
ncbi:hypothetical protein [Streptomyces olindensis]|uniref:hypothetical protein n=1 Tax=Streptomyces olindensis TaxID=358823 RepID=UPI0033C99D54